VLADRIPAIVAHGAQAGFVVAADHQP
jgi:hypothetical protein